MGAQLFVEHCFKPPLPGALPWYCLFNEARASPSFLPMTSSFIQDQLVSMVARFICEAQSGDTLLLPAMAALHKREDGRICMSRRGSLPTPLWEPLSHDIVAKVVRWSREDLQAA
jgi:hypothetical protein